MKSMTIMEYTGVTMSSAYDNNRFPPRNALSDDDLFIHTDKGVGQFWKGLFANGAHTITQVRIKNRGDCCSERLSKANIFIGNQLCGRIPNIPAGRTGKWYTLECKNPIIGSSIKIVTTRDDYLNFSQLEVYGMKKQKLAKQKGASKLIVYSAGEDYGNFTKFEINDEQIFTAKDETGGRGINIIAIEPRTHNVLIKRAYNTADSERESK